jgi:conjugal transfer pilus assembly protein TraI
VSGRSGTVPHIPLPQPPSVDLGLERVPVERLLSDNAELIGRVKICYGRDRVTFERELLEVIRRYAAFVNALPATADNIFSDVGGLFRLGLEVGFYSLQGSDSYIVSGKSTITARRVLEPRWRFGCFLAGLTSELHRTLNQVIVTDEAGGTWPQYLGPLTPWLEHRRSGRLFIRWLKERPESRATALFAVPHIFPIETMGYLSEDNSIVVPHMLACISGIPVPGEPNAITEVVRRASAAVCNRATESSVHRFGRQIHGAHLERYLIDAMRQLVASSPAWQPNGERSRVWIGKEGLFVVWPNAADDIRKMLEDDEIPGVPRSADTIREILEAAGFFERLPDGGNLWQITPPSAQQPLGAVRVSSPALLTLRDAPPADVDLPTLLKPQASVSAPASGAAARKASSPAPKVASPAAAPAVVLEPELPLAPPAVDPPAAASTLRAEEPACARGGNEPARITLDAPFTLEPAVRDALGSAIEAIGTTGADALAAVTHEGVFVSLAALRRRNLDVRPALRSMGEAAIVAVASGLAVTSTRTLADGPAEGVTILPAFLPGWRSADVQPQPMERSC